MAPVLAVSHVLRARSPGLFFRSPVDRGLAAGYTAELDCLEGFPSGQRDQTVNLTAQPSEVRILPPPPTSLRACSVKPSSRLKGRPLARSGAVRRRGYRGRRRRAGQASGSSVPPRAVGLISRPAIDRSGASAGASGYVRRLRMVSICGCSSMVEPQPSKLMVWVRFPSPAPHVRAAVEVAPM